MLFNQLNIGDKVYIIEVVGTFKKTTEYNEGSVTQVSAVYDEPLPPGQFPMPNQPRKRIVDITIQCNGETKSSLYLRINQLLLIVHQVLLYLQINRKL